MPPERTGDAARPARRQTDPADPRQPCCHEGPRCEHIALERNRYFTGKYMAARDFRDEQDYFVSRHRLHNRLLHGWGIVCGLTVDPHWDPRCADRRVVVRRGIAIDCCGRELVLRQDAVVDVWPAPDETPPNPNEPPDDAQRKGDPYGKEPPPARRYLIYLKYCEEPIECVPALYDDACGCGQHGGPHEEANRVKELARLEVKPFDDVDPECWPIRSTGTGGQGSYGAYGIETKGSDDAGEVGKDYDDCSKADVMPGCLEPNCLCGHLVPLAVVTAPDVTRPIGEDDIDTSGRRMLRTPPEYLTHIVDINWPHGGAVTLAELRALKGQLRVTFDRKIQPNDGEATGINEHTFVVQYGGVQRTLEFLPSTPETPTLEDEHVAVFTIEEAKLDPKDRRGNVAGNVVYVTVKCDFILDCRGNSVDGDHLKGQRPTGDGVKGGVFESWFRVTYD